MLDQIGPLLLDVDRADAERRVGVVLHLVHDLQTAFGLDAGLLRVVDAARQVAVRARHSARLGDGTELRKRPRHAPRGDAAFGFRSSSFLPRGPRSFPAPWAEYCRARATVGTVAGHPRPQEPCDRPCRSPGDLAAKRRGREGLYQAPLLEICERVIARRVGSRYLFPGRTPVRHGPTGADRIVERADLRRRFRGRLGVPERGDTGRVVRRAIRGRAGGAGTGPDGEGGGKNRSRGRASQARHGRDPIHFAVSKRSAIGAEPYRRHSRFLRRSTRRRRGIDGQADA